MYNNSNYEEIGGTIAGEGERSGSLINVGVFIACMAIAASVAMILFQTFEGKPRMANNHIVGKAAPALGESALVRP